MDNRYYLQALGVTGLFVSLLILFWAASGGPASEAAVRDAQSTRTAIALTGSYLLQPHSPTPARFTPTSLAPTHVFALTPAVPGVPSPTNTSLLSQFNTPISSMEPSLTPLPTQTAVAQGPVPQTRISSGEKGSRATAIVPPSATATVAQDPAEFARWYFTRVWNERDYQNLWDNYLTTSYKTSVGSGIFEDYVEWWDSVERVEVIGADVLENNGRDARVRVDLTFHMRDGRVVTDQVYDYDFLYDPARGTWMFDASA